MLLRAWNLAGLCCVFAFEFELDALDAFEGCVLEFGLPALDCDADLATGRDIPRSFPRLATPTPQVKVVR